MSFYMQSRRRPESLVDNRIWAYLALFGVVLIALGLLLKAGDAADLRDVTAKS